MEFLGPFCKEIFFIRGGGGVKNAEITERKLRAKLFILAQRQPKLSLNIGSFCDLSDCLKPA